MCQRFFSPVSEPDGRRSSISCSSDEGRVSQGSLNDLTSSLEEEVNAEAELDAAAATAAHPTSHKTAQPNQPTPSQAATPWVMRAGTQRSTAKDQKRAALSSFEATQDAKKALLEEALQEKQLVQRAIQDIQSRVKDKGKRFRLVRLMRTVEDARIYMAVLDDEKVEYLESLLE